MKELIKKIIHRLIGWYIDPVIADNIQINNRIDKLDENVGSIGQNIDSIVDEIRQLKTELNNIEREHSCALENIKVRVVNIEDCIANIKGQSLEFNQHLLDIEHREQWTRDRFAGQEQRLSDIESREEWTRERFAGQEQRLSDIESREEWTRERFEGHDKRLFELENSQKSSIDRFAVLDQCLADLENNEERSVVRYEGHDRRLSDIERREQWTRDRFEGHDQRLSDIEKREGWTRDRFAGHEQRLSDIESREDWTRRRFEGHDEKIYEFIRWNSILEKRTQTEVYEPKLKLDDIAEVPRSRLCTAKELLSTECQKYRESLHIDDVCMMLRLPRYSRKEWEFETICGTLDKLGMLIPGKTGIGFAVGQEPLPAYFASRGCVILASDLSPEADTEGLWSDTNQNTMGSLSNLNKFNICPQDIFEKKVSYRDIDMNCIPEDIGVYDFCWSTCAIEHIGSLENSINFLKNMLTVLKPGGVAIHTTEINLSSNISTIVHGNSAIFRDRDIQEVYQWMTKQGHSMKVDFTRGNTDMDVRMPVTGKEYTDYMLNCNIEGYNSTSFAFIIIKSKN